MKAYLQEIIIRKKYVYYLVLFTFARAPFNISGMDQLYIHASFGEHVHEFSTKS